MPDNVKVSEEATVETGTALQVYDWGADAGAGMDDAGIDERITPLLRILHYQCPEVDRHDPAFVPGAEPGMFLNTATREVFDGVDTGLDVVIAARQRHFAEWVPRSRGGGFRGFHDPREEVVNQLRARHGRFGRLPWVNPTTNEEVELVETGQLFVLYAPPPLSSDVARYAILSFTSASYPTYASVITRHNEWVFRQPDGTRKAAPAWAYRWRIRAVPTQNDKGKFFVPRIELAPPARNHLEALYIRDDPALFQAARDFALLVREGSVKYDMNQAEAGATGGGPGRSGLDDEVPF